MKNVKALWADTLFLIRPVWKHGRLVVVLRLLGSVIAYPLGLLATVSVAQAVIDRIFAGGTMPAVLGVVGVYFLIYAVSWLLQDGVTLFYTNCKEQEIRRKIEKEVFLQAQDTDYRWLDDPAYFQKMTLALRSYPSWSQLALIQIAAWLGGVTGSIAMIGVISGTGPVLALITAGFIIVSMLFSMRITKVSTAQSPVTAKMDQRITYVTRIYQDPGRAAELKSTRLTDKLGKRYDGSVAEYLRNMRILLHKGAFLNMGRAWTLRLADYAVILYAAFGLLTGRVESVGVFATLIAAAAALSSNLTSLTDIGALSVRIREYASYARSFYELDSPIENSKGEMPAAGAHTLEFRHVGFRYPSGGFALRDLDFSVSPGEHIAIVGENGAGKTTMMKLLLRLYDVNEGEIRIDGQPLRFYDVRALRRSIGVAFQESHDYALSLRENLQFYTDAADETLREALRRAGLERLSESLDTDLTREFDENGSVLSGGEKQKLALARLFCADLGLLLLDEPSAALDPLAEYELMQSLMTLAEGKTVVMVAHRLSTVRHMDRILVIDHGALAEEGTHEELMARNGIYAEMFRKQGENYVA
jgi:ATP-binding cassette subfamily B protein